MRRWLCSFVLGTVCAGCGGSQGDASDPNAVPAGYTRFETLPTPEIPAGADQMFVQWLQGPADVDRDALDVRGSQSKGGHHVILFATQETQPDGFMRPWADSDMSADLRYVGGLGEGAEKQRLPEGTVFRIPAGWSLIANLHWINTTDKPIVGKATIDFEFADPSSERKPVGIFLNMTTKFSVPPAGETSAEAFCSVKEEISMIRIANHMHSSGLAADTEIQHADGTREDLIRDDAWDPIEYLDPKLTQWAPATPYVLAPGDVVHTTCSWRNKGTQALEFPVEMCSGVAYFVSGDGRVQPCLNGNWL